ncbi:TonB-dependent receptor [Terriglobus roseus]|uniref:TonB-dependent receptor n=1 Tax=Terriglobus roseus TaxID=392734 RepID=UPI00031BDEF8|nr:TonB-dependent receptor [Terriglobus roseus]
MRVLGRLGLALAVTVLSVPGTVNAQAVYGSIYGTVTDNSGAAVPNADVVVTDTAKGTSVTVKTNESGAFRADHLVPDDYSVKVTMQGFKSFEQTSVHVFADTAAKIDAPLAVGSANETIQVRADQQPQLKADRSDVSTTLTAKEIVDLPIAGRNFTGLQLLLPGAQELTWSHAASENPQGSKQIEVDGQAFAGTAFQLDGTDNQDPILGIIVVNPNADSLSETKITTQNFDAEFGKAVSSVVTAQTKSGTNAFHGSAFDYRQSNANLARDPFVQSTKSAVPVGLKNQFGGSLGGPILKDRLFFFGDYQGVRQKVGSSILQTVPTQHLIQTCLGQATALSGIPGCDFTEYANYFSAPAAGGSVVGNFTPVAQPFIFRPGTATGYTNNVIPTAQLSQPALALLKQLQPYAPNTSGSNRGLTQNYSGNGTGLFNSDQWDVRGDYTASDRIHAFGRFSRFTDTLTGPVAFGVAGGAGFGLGGYGGTSKGANSSAAAGVDVVLSNSLITDVRLGYFRYNIATSKFDGGQNSATTLGIPGLNTGSVFTSGSPAWNITEVGAFGGPNNSQSVGPQYGSGLNINRCNCTLTQREDQFQLANNWTKTFGNHSVKFGADLRYARNLRVPSDNNRTGELRFGTGPTSGGNATNGLGFATFVLGDVTTFQRYVSTSTNAKEFQKRDFFYAQDTWRITPKITFNYGLRYELYFPEAVNGKGNGSLLDLNTGFLRVAGFGNIGSNMNYGMPKNTYNPRIGIAYQVTDRTVVRAGYGRSFDIGVFGSIFGHAATQNLPTLANQSLTGSGGDNATNNANFAFTLAAGPAAPTPVTVPANGLLPNPGDQVTSRTRPDPLRLPTLDAWNASLQQSLTPTLSMTIAYVGNKGTHTFGDVSGNTTNPNEAAITLPAAYSINGATLHYDPSVANGISANGGTKNQTYLTRYYGGKLPACAGNTNATNAAGTVVPGACGWTQGITNFSDDLNTHYNALQVTLTKSMTHGYSFNVNYALQQAISQSTGFSTWDKNIVRGNDGALRRSQITGYGLFELPFGKTRCSWEMRRGY